MTHDPRLFSVALRNILTVHRETLTQYITFKRGGEREVCTLVLGSLATGTSCIDASVRLVSKPPKVGPLLIFYISLWVKGTEGW